MNGSPKIRGSTRLTNGTPNESMSGPMAASANRAARWRAK